ncbi:TOMM precursor leader peptide-binding protein [[Mycobacterium] crassicus]|uniref:TOMM leader peptide-binding protein n=1 Tax=[Mycobacterium] crassicus TaxID=2872309 RepID=A0ABU5XKG6_9MYCO|nr:TOMM precursor leader peptide-binding protein [Mycolicibacter sp. MYC098]MEB3022663.1 TOMM precursor leader peptide-binding protein [Mycolicibacter sp. MYC098]
MTAQAAYALDPALPVLLRPDGPVQVGWDPQRAVLVHPPQGLSPAGLAALLRTMQTPSTVAELRHEAARHGTVDAAQLDDLLTALVRARVAVLDTGTPRPRRAASLRVHGRGPLSDLLVESLRCSGSVVRRSSHPHAVVSTAGTDLVVLSDYLVTEPRLVRELHAERVPHLPVRVRDGTGVIGPLVLPGRTSCLGCADLHRRDRDAAWPALAAQLRDTVAHTDRATVLATVALALSQVELVIAAVRGMAAGRQLAPPPTLNATLEVDLSTGSILTRRWNRHPLCDC